VEDRDLLHLTADYAADFLEGLDVRPVRAQGAVDGLRGPLPHGGMEPEAVIAALVEAADPGIVASAGGRYFGFVVGGGLPAALAADWLATAWDQNAAMHVMSPAAAAVEETCREWLAQLLGMPAHVSAAFTTGCQMAHVTALAAAREHLGTSQITVLVGGKRHVTVDRALRLLGIDASVIVVPADDQGRMLADELPSVDGATIVCAQAGEVNTGACDPFGALADARDAAANAWLHVDGAFGMWAAVSGALRHLVGGVERADSWATDAHKWLNVPYDCGAVFTAHPESHSAAFSTRAPYLVVGSDTREAVDWNPEHSRRARGFTVYAAIRSLGRRGIAELVEGCCAHARRFADGIGELGGEVLNDVELNQVLFRFPDDADTEAALAAVQASGDAWMSGTSWDGRPAIRISVSNWQTSTDDVERTLDAYRVATGGHAAAR
jgi:glutamate/tyrosine decarboxylase-like PLP-dependent enzyme